MYLRIVGPNRHTNIVSFIQTKKTMNKIQIAAELLRERTEHTTDATAFIVKETEDRIVLCPDTNRRGGVDLGTFYHMEDVVTICLPLKLSFWITEKMYPNEEGNIRARFEVHIY